MARSLLKAFMTLTTDGARACRDVPAVLDVEASGFGRQSYPIEIGFVLPDGRAHCRLVAPVAGWTHWDAAAERTHGIARDLLLRHGHPVVEVADWLNAHLAGLTVYCDGWAHDYAWLHTLFEAAGRRPSFRLDHLLARIAPERLPQWHDAQVAARARLGIDRHRASSDARVLQVAWLDLQAAGDG